MSDKDIVQNMISQLGQSQHDRPQAALEVHFVDVDERDTNAFLRFSKQLAKYVNYYAQSTTAPLGDWTKFFGYDDDEASLDALCNNPNGDTNPNLALFLAFLKGYEATQVLINRFTGRHLNFYYQNVLQLLSKPAVPDKAHVVLELKKQAPQTAIAPGTLFSAGKDGIGVELLYAATRETIVSAAKVQSIRSLFVDTSGHGRILGAPVANSLDGIGEELPKDNPRWHGFGYDELSAAETARGYKPLRNADVGFAISSPVLRMKEGNRTVTVVLDVSAAGYDLPSLNVNLADAFAGFITNEKNWTPVDVTSAGSSAGKLSFQVTIPASEKAIADYDQSIHGYNYTATAPVLQILLSQNASALGYNDFKDIQVNTVEVKVDVTGIKDLDLESDEGTLDPKKAFLPFGPQPAKGSLFFVGCDEALSKKLNGLSVDLQWKGAPPNFNVHYQNYSNAPSGNKDFSVDTALVDGSGKPFNMQGAELFDDTDASAEHSIDLGHKDRATSPATPGPELQTLYRMGGRWKEKAVRLTAAMPLYQLYFHIQSPERPGFISFKLRQDFLHADYRTEYVANILKYAKSHSTHSTPTVLNEPYTPVLQSLTLSYSATSGEVSVASENADDFANQNVQFFQIGYFGEMRDHGHQRAQFDFVTDKRILLLPAYDNEGELFIGVSDLTAGDSVSLLFQVAEGSADPDLPRQEIVWSVLCENYWKLLGADNVVSDTTNELLTSGIITFILPGEATTENTILPPGQIWLRASVAEKTGAICQLIAIQANALEVQFLDQGNDPLHLGEALPAGKIAKLKNGLATIKSVTQPFASFGGATWESDQSYHVRVSERLRHKDRCITPWDYERMVLAAFPNIDKVKCIPHSQPGSWFSPGHVTLVVVPDLRNKNALDPLQPKVDANTMAEILDFVSGSAERELRPRDGMQVQVHVKNPNYQPVKVDFNVKFRRGYEPNYHARELNTLLVQFFSPWAFTPERDISFGGKIYKSVILDFVEDWEPVDYVTDFSMTTYVGSWSGDLNEVQAETPDTIIVSNPMHAIHLLA
jgi:hypothetical protein